MATCHVRGVATLFGTRRRPRLIGGGEKPFLPPLPASLERAQLPAKEGAKPCGEGAEVPLDPLCPDAGPAPGFDRVGRWESMTGSTRGTRCFLATFYRLDLHMSMSLFRLLHTFSRATSPSLRWVLRPQEKRVRSLPG